MADVKGEDSARLRILAREFQVAKERQAAGDPFFEADLHERYCAVRLNYRAVGGHNASPVCSCALPERRRIVELESQSSIAAIFAKAVAESASCPGCGCTGTHGPDCTEVLHEAADAARERDQREACLRKYEASDPRPMNMGEKEAFRAGYEMALSKSVTEDP